jgi:excisionase family DNA binding protein
VGGKRNKPTARGKTGGCNMHESGMLTVPEAAQLLGYSEITVWRHLGKGLIRKSQVSKGYKVLIPYTEVLRIKTGIDPSEAKDRDRVCR